MRKFIGFEINIPDEFRDNEDVFINRLLELLKQKTGNSIRTFVIQERGRDMVVIPADKVFTGAWEFLDELDESHYNYAADDAAYDAQKVK